MSAIVHEGKKLSLSQKFSRLSVRIDMKSDRGAAGVAARRTVRVDRHLRSWHGRSKLAHEVKRPC